MAHGGGGGGGGGGAWRTLASSPVLPPHSFKFQRHHSNPHHLHPPYLAAIVLRMTIAPIPTHYHYSPTHILSLFFFLLTLIYSYPVHILGLIFSHTRKTRSLRRGLQRSSALVTYATAVNRSPLPLGNTSLDLSYPCTMASASTAVEGGEVKVTVAETAAKAPRRFPPPCWTQDETLVLIEAYRERWYALRRGYLRTADWDAVAETVANRCPDATTAKTSAQCRHKMEKLRQRYRAEKQRSVTYPYPAGRFFSSWFFFDYMEAMENGTTPPVEAQKSGNSGDGPDPNPYPDQNSLKLKVKSKNSTDSSPDFGFYSGVKQNKFNPDTKISNHYPKYLEEEDMPPDENPVKSRSRKLMNGIPKNVDFGNGFHQEMLPPGLRGKKIEKNSKEEYWGNIFVGPTYRAAAKQRRDAVEEMVESINFLGEGYMKMERAKMEMAREMEGIRREMEMKRNEMILESQKKMVGAFAKGLFEMKRIKKTKYADAEEKSH